MLVLLLKGNDTNTKYHFRNAKDEAFRSLIRHQHPPGVYGGKKGDLEVLLWLISSPLEGCVVLTAPYQVKMLLAAAKRKPDQTGFHQKEIRHLTQPEVSDKRSSG